MREAIQISGIYSNIISFAIQQNHVPIIRQLVIKNFSDSELKNLEVKIVTDPDIVDEWTAKIDSIMPEQEHVITGINLRISASRLFELTERINGTLAITISDDSGIIIAGEKRELSFLSYDEWSGSSVFPELLAAFVTPNHPYITEIIKSAGSLLADWTGAPSFKGYQSKNPNHVRKQMAAIYGALQRENIAYCMPPASFEKHGQRVRLCGAIKEQRLGTCLDLALLYASCLEAAGLHPMIVLIKGHAFTGCWLEEESFAECVQDDVSAITKRIAPGINEICVVETTAFTSGKEADFEDAVLAAGNHLRTPEDFEYLVDVRRSRGGGIRPIPQKREDGAFLFDDGISQGSNSVISAPDELEILGKLEHVESVEFTRQQIWERKLLDLSLRNSLLNFRVTKNSIQLFVNSLHDLEDALSDGEEFQIMPKPQDVENSLRDNKIYESISQESIWDTLIKSEFKSHRIRTYLDEAALSASVLSLYRSAKTSMEENGANTLYLAMGFLKWFESDASEKAHYAPLVLIPVDIIRKSAQRGYVIRQRDEEPQFNVTLLEMLRADFGMAIAGLDPLPLDEHGVDIKMAFHIIRQSVMNRPRWDVEELAFMGIFSFTQFIMWNDIRNRADDLKRNKVVKSLISGKMTWEPDISFPAPETLDDTVAPADLAVPISADSSQLAAIYAAGQGRSFVLHGPPGTGKSQTITNIIANALYQGKSVLFVAEKMAALSVVEKRLNAIGIGDFCLELHSNKARKKDVLDKLEKALNVGRFKAPQRYRDEADAILTLRRELNAVVRELHLPRQFGFSLYEAISRAEQHEPFPDCMDFSDEQISKLTPQQYSRWKELCDMLSAAGISCGGVHGHALREYKNQRYSQSERAEIESRLGEYRTALSALEAIEQKVIAALGLGSCSGAIRNYAQHEALSELCSRLANAAGRIPANVLIFKDLPFCEDKIIALCASGRRRDTIKRELSAVFSEHFFEFDAQTALLQWKQSATSWFLPKMVGESKIVNSVKLCALNKNSYDKSKTQKYLELVSEYQKSKTAVNDNADLLNNLFGVIFDNGNCDWSLIENITALAANLQKLLKRIASDINSQNSAINSLSASLDENFDNFITANKTDWNKVAGYMKELSELESALSTQFENPFGQWHEEPDWISAMSERASRWSLNLGGLRDYCGYLQVKSELDSEGLQTVHAALENASVKEDELAGAFIKSLSKKCAAHTIDSTSALNSFRGYLFSQKIEKFKALNKQFEILTRQELAARLSAQIPVLSTGVSDSSEIGILQRAIKSGGRMMPVRRLFECIPNLLRKLSPCMLMSPISVAQYLDPKYPAFDLIVFDEASQLPTSKAVGAIARGNELIVVGDPKQLPPTSFFASNQADEDNFEKEDLESVLDDCLALTMPQMHLLWHYRSKHESLIAFSNRKYYENKLFTFPSPNDIVSQVRLIPVDGFYDRGKTKQNRAEAEAIISEITRRLSDPDPVRRNRSIGVVTFSSVQQNLIADMLEAEFRKRPDLDELANSAEEPIFIKNLENVQGDERDIILFSVGYGPDEQGRVALNFGPLNRDGGWRRLNVAVSRARYEMIIFSVLKPDQIDLNKTRSDGLAGLKSFLEFADRGIRALAEANNKNISSQGAVEVIAKGIRKLGYRAQTNIGCSGYQVDIGVIHPQNPDIYVLGILCDSMNYYNGGTASDRNNTQEAVLRGLGWRICRTWVLDWWDNPEKELSRIRAEIETAIKGGATPNEQSTAATAPSMVAGPEKATVSRTALVKFDRLEDNTPVNALEPYKTAQLAMLDGYAGNSDYFADNASTVIIKRQISTVLEAEAPISHEILCKRVMEAWGITRMGSRINRRFDQLISAMHIKSTKQGDTVFYWKDGMEAKQYDDFRVPSKDDKTRRNLESIAPEEIASAVKYILNQQIGLLREDLEREISRIFGFARCTEAMQKSIRAGIEIAIKRRWAVLDGERVNAMS